MIPLPAERGKLLVSQLRSLRSLRCDNKNFPITKTKINIVCNQQIMKSLLFRQITAWATWIRFQEHNFRMGNYLRSEAGICFMVADCKNVCGFSVQKEAKYYDLTMIRIFSWIL